MKKHILWISFLLLPTSMEMLWAIDTKEVQIHGFISQGVLKSDHNNYLSVKSEKGSFEFNEAGINFTTRLNDDLRLGIQFFARDLGIYGNDNIQLDWAYADYRMNNHLGIRIGKIKVAYGLYNEVRDYDSVRTSIMLPMSIYTEADRELLSSLKGISIYGELPYGLSYQAGCGATTARESSAGDEIKYYVGEHIKENTNISDVSLLSTEFKPDFITFAAIQWQTPLDGLRLGLSQIMGSADFTFMYDIMGVTLPVYLTFDSLSNTVGSIEYMFGSTLLTAELSSVILKSTIEVESLSADEADKKNFGGVYVGISHRFLEWFEIGTHYSVYYTDFDDKKGEDEDYFYRDDNNVKIHAAHLAWEKDLCMTLRLDPNEYWTIKLEGHKINGTAFVDIINYENKDLSENFFMFAGKISYNF